MEKLGFGCTKGKLQLMSAHLNYVDYTLVTVLWNAVPCSSVDGYQYISFQFFMAGVNEMMVFGLLHQVV